MHTGSTQEGTTPCPPCFDWLPRRWRAGGGWVHRWRVSRCAVTAARSATPQHQRQDCSGQKSEEPSLYAVHTLSPTSVKGHEILVPTMRYSKFAPVLFVLTKTVSAAPLTAT